MRHFTRKPHRWSLPVLILAAALLPAVAGDLALTARVQARAVAPGEPLRVEAFAAEPLRSLEAEFLGHTVHMLRAGSTGEGQRWTGWAMIGLDEKPGVAALELRGSTESGRRAVGSLAVTVEPKEFPEERLTVAPKYVEPPKEVQDRLVRERARLKEIYASRRDVPPPVEVFVRPVPGDASAQFGTRRFFNDKPRSPHGGVDLRAAAGTEVRASGPGLVVLSADLYYSGNLVILDHGGGLFTLYAHLSELRVEEGQEVAAGQVLGLSGATGRVTGPHLHWGAKIGDRPFDPRALLDPALFE